MRNCGFSSIIYFKSLFSITVYRSALTRTGPRYGPLCLQASKKKKSQVTVYHIPILENAKKQGEMSLPILSPIPFIKIIAEFRDGRDWGWVMAFPLVSSSYKSVWILVSLMNSLGLVPKLLSYCLCRYWPHTHIRGYKTQSSSNRRSMLQLNHQIPWKRSVHAMRSYW